MITILTGIAVGTVKWGVWAAGEYGIKTAVVGAVKWAWNYGAWALVIA